MANSKRRNGSSAPAPPVEPEELLVPAVDAVQDAGSDEATDKIDPGDEEVDSDGEPLTEGDEPAEETPTTASEPEEKLSPEQKAAASAEKILAAQKKWRQKNRAKVREYQRKWRKANPEKIQESHKRYQELHPERVREWHKRAADNRKAMRVLAKERILQLRQDLAKETGDEAWLDPRVKEDALVLDLMVQRQAAETEAEATPTATE